MNVGMIYILGQATKFFPLLLLIESLNLSPNAIYAILMHV